MTSITLLVLRSRKFVRYDLKYTCQLNITDILSEAGQKGRKETFNGFNMHKLCVLVFENIHFDTKVRQIGQLCQVLW